MIPKIVNKTVKVLITKAMMTLNKIQMQMAGRNWLKLFKIINLLYAENHSYSGYLEFLQLLVQLGYILS